MGVHRLHYACVSEQGLHYLGVFAPLEKSRAECVTQAVEGKPCSARPAFFKSALYSRW